MDAPPGRSRHGMCFVLAIAKQGAARVAVRAPRHHSRHPKRREPFRMPIEPRSVGTYEGGRLAAPLAGWERAGIR